MYIYALLWGVWVPCGYSKHIMGCLGALLVHSQQKPTRTDQGLNLPLLSKSQGFSQIPGIDFNIYIYIYTCVCVCVLFCECSRCFKWYFSTCFNLFQPVSTCFNHPNISFPMACSPCFTLAHQRSQSMRPAIGIMWPWCHRQLQHQFVYWSICLSVCLSIYLPTYPAS